MPPPGGRSRRPHAMRRIGAQCLLRCWCSYPASFRPPGGARIGQLPYIACGSPDSHSRRPARCGWVTKVGLRDGRNTSLTVQICLAQESEADKLLNDSPLALVIGMVLDQQVPFETAFAGPKKIAE